MKFYPLYVHDAKAVFDASEEALAATTFNHEEEVLACPKNVELRALIAEGKSRAEVHAAMCAHHDEDVYDLFWAAIVFSPVTQLSSDSHQTVVVGRMITEFPAHVGLLAAVNLHPTAKVLFDAAMNRTAAP